MSNTNHKLEELHTIDGVYKTTLPEKFKNRKGWVRPDVRQVFSYIPGTITSVLVKAGDKVEKGQPLLTFNAMKMSNTYASPISGTVDKVCVEANQAVPKGLLLIEFK